MTTNPTKIKYKKCKEYLRSKETKKKKKNTKENKINCM